jgi:hypothetical protein
MTQNVKKYNCKAAYRLKHSSERNSVTRSKGILLGPRFRFGQEGEHSGEPAERCDPQVLPALGGKTYLQEPNAAFLFVHHVLSREMDEKCTGGTESSICTVVPVCYQILCAKNLVDGTKNLYQWQQQILIH